MARASAEKALALDDTVADAHAALGAISTFYDWDWRAAAKHFARSLQINPDSAENRMWHSFLLDVTGRCQEGVREMETARDLDPLSTLVVGCHAMALLMARRYEDAMQVLQEALLLDPHYYFSHYLLGIACRERGRPEEAIGSFRRALDLSGSPWIQMLLASVQHRFGDRAEADRLFADLTCRSADEPVPPTCFIYMHLLRDEVEEARRWRERAREERDCFLPWFRVLPDDALRLPHEAELKASLV
jgi:Flp pilus assembly protein TadD